MGKRVVATQVVTDLEGAMTVGEYNEAVKGLPVLRAEVVEARSNLQVGTVEEKREARGVLQSARAALAKAETVVAKVTTMSDFTFELGVVMTADAGQIGEWIDQNAQTIPWGLCDPDTPWVKPPTEPLKPTTLAKVKWGEWRRHLVTACLVPMYEPKRSRGAITETGSMEVGPYGGLPTVSAKGKAMFHQLRERVRLDFRTGALYYVYFDGEVVNRKRILADEGERRQVFLKYWHDSEVCAHRGRDSTFEKLTASFFNLTRNEVEMLIRETEVYQVSSKTKNPEKVTNPLMTSRPMEHLQMDLVDFHQYKGQNNQYTFLLVVVDCFSKFLWAFPLKKKEAPEVLSKLRALFMTEGIPTILQSDNGTEFVSDASRAYYERCGIIFRTGRAYKPSSQGQVERTNRTLKSAIYHDILATDNYDWVTNLDLRVFSYNTLTQTSAGRTPFEIHRGRKMTWMSDGNDRTSNNASDLISIVAEGQAVSLTQREKDLVAADERLLMTLTKTPDEIRTYLDVQTTMPRLVDLSNAEEATPAVDVVEEVRPMADDEMDDDEPQAIPESEEEEGAPGDGCPVGMKKPRGNPTGPCEPARKTKTPSNLRDYVVPKPKKQKK
jgi:hypothetical protein